MTWVETVRAGWEAIRSHRLRSLLTMLGIIIGVSSVMVTVGLGQGAQDKVKQQIAALGSNLLIVAPGSTTSSTGVRGGAGSATTLTLADAAAMTSPVAAPDVAAVAPQSSSSATLAAGSTTWTTQVIGSTTSWVGVHSRSFGSGRFFSTSEAASGANVVVLGSDTAAELFAGPISPVGQTITVDGTPLTVIGVLSPTGASSSGSSQDDLAVVPLSTLRKLTGAGGTSVSTVYVEATNGDTLSAAYQEVSQLLDAMHGVTASTADFTVTSQQALVSTANATNRTLTVLLGGIAAISLLVGGIGVMNIMLVSVTERIREIGLRKALGATPRVIRRQFLVEASLLGLLGGLIGVVLGYVAGGVLPGWIGQPVSVSSTAAAGALLTALMLGIGFGVYPASRAARLTPIDALRTE